MHTNKSEKNDALLKKLPRTKPRPLLEGKTVVKSNSNIVENVEKLQWYLMVYYLTLFKNICLLMKNNYESFRVYYKIWKNILQTNAKKSKIKSGNVFKHKKTYRDEY